jgi:hypothetical protein
LRNCFGAGCKKERSQHNEEEFLGATEDGQAPNSSASFILLARSMKDAAGVLKEVAMLRITRKKWTDGK